MIQYESCIGVIKIGIRKLILLIN